MLWLVMITAILLDQLTKLMAPLYGVAVLTNMGISFGWLADMPSGLGTIGLFILAFGLLRLWFKQGWLKYPGLSGLFWAGVVSNLMDRVLLGGVTDWLVLPGWHVKNNLADIYLVVALMALLFTEMKERSKGHRAG